MSEWRPPGLEKEPFRPPGLETFRPPGLEEPDAEDVLDVDLFQGQGMGGGESWEPPSMTEIVGTLREWAHGSSYGMSDDLEALTKSLTGGEDFRSELQRIQGQREEYREDNPYYAAGMEFLGGMMTGGVVARSVGLGNTLAGTVARQGGAGALEAGVYGFFNADELADRVHNAGIAALFGGGLGTFGGSLAYAVSPQRMARTAAKQLEKLKASLDGMPEAEKLTILHQRASQRALENKIRGEMPGYEVPGPKKLYKMVADELGLDYKEMKTLADKTGGFTDFRDLSAKELMDWSKNGLKPLLRADDEAAAIKARGGRSTKASFDTMLAPIKRMMENQVSKRYAAYHNRAQNRALVQMAEFHDQFEHRLNPIRKFMDSNDGDGLWLKEKLLNMANGSTKDMQAARAFIKNRWGKQMLKDFDTYLDAAEKWAARYHNSLNTFVPVTRGWLHTQVVKPREKGLIAQSVHPNTYTDTAAKLKTRPIFDLQNNADDIAKVQAYDNPLATMADWIDDHAAAINTAELFQLRPAGRVDLMNFKKPKAWEKYSDTEKKAWLAKVQEKARKEDYKALTQGERGGYIGRAMRERLEADGYDETSIKNAIELGHTLLYDAQRAPSQLVRSLRDLGYSGTLFNPYGAALNLHDVFNAASAMGIRNAIGSLFSKSPISAEEAGLARQYMGEFVKKLGQMEPQGIDKYLSWTDKMSEKFAKWSGFREVDRFGKEKIMAMALREAREAVTNGNFDKQWQYTFNAGERLAIKNALKNGEVTDLVRELAMFRLSQIQPINAAQSTKFALNNPNARIFYMLKNFAIRQVDFLRENALNAWKRGDKAQAARFAAQYVLYSGGGYALIHEARQPLAGRESDFSPGNLATNTLRQGVSVGTFGISGTSDYSWEKFWDNPVKEFANGIVPPTNLIEATWADAYGMIKEGKPPVEVLKNLPVVGKTLFSPLLDEED